MRNGLTNLKYPPAGGVDSGLLMIIVRKYRRNSKSCLSSVLLSRLLMLMAIHGHQTPVQRAPVVLELPHLLHDYCHFFRLHRYHYYDLCHQFNTSFKAPTARKSGFVPNVDWTVDCSYVIYHNYCTTG